MKTYLAATYRFRGLLMLLSAAGVLSVVTYKTAQSQESLDSWKFSMNVKLGKDISPVPLNLQGRRADLVYLGSYVVNTAGCVGCHTCPTYRGINPYQVGGNGLGPLTKPGPVNNINFMAGGTPFGGIKVPNLTPDSAGLPGGLTFEQFADVMQNGADPHTPGRVLQVMPWPLYRNMFQGELTAIYEYLSAIPAAIPGTCAGPGAGS